MTRIDFYILQDSTSDARWHFACRLIDKALHSGLNILVITDSLEEAQHIDDLLWSFKPESFIPHALFDPQTSAVHMQSAPVIIATIALLEHQLEHHHGLLINLGQQIPPWFSRFERLSEIVIQEPTVLKNTREHFSFYRERGYPIEHRNI
jgi:DNA polymerase-3 subunit chi